MVREESEDPRSDPGSEEVREDDREDYPQVPGPGWRNAGYRGDAYGEEGLNNQWLEKHRDDEKGSGGYPDNRRHSTGEE